MMAIVQMPRGAPVATMGIGNSVNAVLLAARIVGLQDPVVGEWVEKHLKEMEVENLDKAKKLQEEGWQTYERSDSKRY